MNLYKATNSVGESHWFLTIKKAKKFAPDITKVEIPVTTQSILEILNDSEETIYSLRQNLKNLERDCGDSLFLVPPIQTSIHKPKNNISEVVDWLLDGATQSQVEQVFSAIGCRWGEARDKNK